MRILLMDDNDTVRASLSHLLSMLSFEVAPAKDGEEALNLYKKSKFDIVILDLTVPGGMGAKETVPKLFEIDPKVLAIVLSGYHDDPVMEHFRDYGFAAAIKKPVTANELSEILSSVIDKTSVPA